MLTVRTSENTVRALCENSEMIRPRLFQRRSNSSNIASLTSSFAFVRHRPDLSSKLIRNCYQSDFLRFSPQDFFKGMGEGYGSVMGIIITAGVFAAGLKATGLIDAFVEVLKSSNEIARWGGSFGPFIMAAITGSGDAATFAFNEAVTPHAASFGMPIPNLGAMALISGQMGRTMSPIAGVVIVLSGLAMVPPIQLVKRTAIPLIVGVVVLALTIV